MISLPGLSNIMGGLQSLMGTPGSSNAVLAQLLSGLIAGSTPVPELDELKLQQYADPRALEYLGDLQVDQMSPTELRNIILDPRFDQAQFESLASLGETANTGMSAIDRARLNEIQAQQAAQARGARESILAQARQRGMGGSGMELAAQLQAQQDAANQASTQGMQVAAAAEQARREAALQRAGLAGNMQQAQFGREATTRSAQDAINQFNIANQNAARERNLQTRQNLQNANISQANQIGQMNTQLANQANIYNTTQRPVTQYGMQSGQMQAIAGGLTGASQMENQNAQAQFAANSQLLGAILNAGGTAVGGGLKSSDRNMKTDVKKADLDIEKFLSEISPYKFKYKEGYGEDPRLEQIGIMAQDLEKSNTGKELVVETDKGKMVDLQGAIPKILASLGYLNDKIEGMS